MSIQRPEALKRLGLAASFGQYLRGPVADGVSSGSARTSATDDNTDYYLVPLSDETLRPGDVYADRYGHVLVLARRIPQSDGGTGVILAVDAQPDGTVARKRFWRGNFLRLPRSGARVQALSADRAREERHIASANQYGNRKKSAVGDFSLDQSRLGIEEFYDRMKDVTSPAALDPLPAMKEEAITALEEQVKARVVSAANGRKFQNSARGDADMPDRASILETIGAWEDFATPARDLRCGTRVSGSRREAT